MSVRDLGGAGFGGTMRLPVRPALRLGTALS